MFERDKVTVFLGVPTMYVAMLNMPEDNRGDASTPAPCAARAARRCPSRS